MHILLSFHHNTFMFLQYDYHYSSFVTYSLSNKLIYKPLLLISELYTIYKLSSLAILQDPFCFCVDKLYSAPELLCNPKWTHGSAFSDNLAE